MESFHPRNGFLRSRMSDAAAAQFDAAVRRRVLEHQPFDELPSGTVVGTTTARVVCSYPLAPSHRAAQGAI